MKLSPGSTSLTRFIKDRQLIDATQNTKCRVKRRKRFAFSAIQVSQNVALAQRMVLKSIALSQARNLRVRQVPAGTIDIDLQFKSQCDTALQCLFG